MAEKHAGSAKRSVTIDADVETIWKKLGKITKLDWLEEQKSSKFLSQKKIWCRCNKINFI